MHPSKIFKPNAQSVLESAVVIILVAAGLILTGPYVIRGVNALFKSYDDATQDVLTDSLKEPERIPSLSNFCGDGLCAENEDMSTCCRDCQSQINACGDSVCCNTNGGSEDAGNCPADCRVCGDGVCNTPYENMTDCCQDCSNSGTNNLCGDGWCCTMSGPLQTSAIGYPAPAGTPTAVNNDCIQDCPQKASCPNTVCDTPWESTANCCSDCYQAATMCGDGSCDSLCENNATCSVDCHCGNGACEPALGETFTNCCTDCKSCGNGFCDTVNPGGCADWVLETAGSCCWDCHVCGNGTCDSCESSTTCINDCPPSCHGNFSCPSSHASCVVTSGCTWNGCWPISQNCEGGYCEGGGECEGFSQTACNNHPGCRWF